MAAEPEKKIEELLHAYSRKRREDAAAPLDVHPATRRMLQGEVARQQGRGELGGASSGRPRAWWKTLLLFGPKYAGALGMFAILAVGVWVITQHDRASRNLRQEASERRAGDEPESVRQLEELAKRDGEKLREVDDLADLRAPAKETENKKAELSKSDSIISDQSKLQTRDADSERPAPAERAMPELKVTEELAREKQVPLQKDAQVGERIANVIAGGAGVTADKNATVLADNLGIPDNRFYKRNEAKADALGVPPPATQPLTASVDLAAAKPTNGYYFAYAPGSPATNVALGTEATTALYAGVKLTAATNAPAEGYLGFADGFAVLVTEWAAVPAEQARDELVRAREFQQEAEWREGASPAFLRRFSVEQNNGAIRIRDAEDGSVYLGQVVTASESNVDGKAKAEVGELRRNFDDTRSAPVTFRASGINQRSRQVVIINGELTEEHERLSAIAGKVFAPAAASAPTEPATGLPAPTSVRPANGPSASRSDQAGAADRVAQGQARSAVRSAPARVIAPTSTASRATSAPVFRATTLRARVQIGPTNELNFRAMRTR